MGVPLVLNKINFYTGIESYVVKIYPCAETGFWARIDMPGGGCVIQGETVQGVQKSSIEAMEMFFDDRPDPTNFFLFFEIYNADDSDY